MLKVLRMTVAALVFQALLFGPALAQDFDSLVRDAASANQQWVAEIDRALEASDLGTLQALASGAVATGEQVESLLQAALPLAPDDASRSRVEGVLTHVTAALESGRAALQDTSFDAARSNVNAMRGEAQEALSEIGPFAPPSVAPAPAELPEAGGLVPGPGVGGLVLATLALCGLLFTLAGIRLRRRLA